MKKVKKFPLSMLSNNTVEELRALLCSLDSEINIYSHVSEHLPASIQREIDKFDKKIQRELEKRGY